MNKEELIEDILDIINSENSGLSHQRRLNEIEKVVSEIIKGREIKRKKLKWWQEIYLMIYKRYY